jgi:hypothetical protein
MHSAEAATHKLVSRCLQLAPEQDVGLQSGPHLQALRASRQAAMRGAMPQQPLGPLTTQADCCARPMGRPATAQVTWQLPCTGLPNSPAKAESSEDLPWPT